ncbi:hypothetical protein GW17_00011800 [Ensete ventricosum]|nr:hypothetical protein GW17_00011800 [Ensete ventricosum]
MQHHRLGMDRTASRQSRRARFLRLRRTRRSRGASPRRRIWSRPRRLRWKHRESRFPILPLFVPWKFLVLGLGFNLSFHVGGGGGYQGGDRGNRGGGGGRRGGGRGGGFGREGDWRCPNPRFSYFPFRCYWCSCGNVNFARRTECNKCGAPCPGGGAGGGGDSSDNNREGDGYSRGGGDYNGGLGGYNISGRGYGGNQAGYGGNLGGRTSGYGGRGGDYGGRGGDYGGRGGSYDNNNHEREDGGSGQVSPLPSSAYGGPIGNYPPAPVPYGSNDAYGVDSIPRSSSYPPSYGAPPPNAYGSEGHVARSGPPSGYSAPPSGNGGGYGEHINPVRDSGVPPRHRGGAFGALPVDPPGAVKQCDENCGESCDNTRIYISNLPPDVTTEDLHDLFGGIGQVARIKQKRGFKDQWPWNIKIYTDEYGNNKGDAVLSYEDPAAAHSAGGFYNSKFWWCSNYLVCASP